MQVHVHVMLTSYDFKILVQLIVVCGFLSEMTHRFIDHLICPGDFMFVFFLQPSL